MAFYGARGSNGVILISTKKGQFNSAPRITFEASVAYQEPETLRDFLNAEEYINVLRPAIAISPSPQWNQSSGYSVSSAIQEAVFTPPVITMKEMYFPMAGKQCPILWILQRH